MSLPSIVRETYVDKTYVIIHVYSYGMSKLFFPTQIVVLLATISICGVSLTIIPVQDADSQQQQQLSADAIFKMVEKSVVGITTPETIREEEEGDDFDSDPIYDGSGFVYAKEDGNIVQIVTNEHVVEDSDTVRVSFSDGSTYTANVLGSDFQEDIAVLEIITNDSTTQQQPPEPLAIGNSSELQIGEPAIAIGYPFLGEQSFSNLLTSGVISEIGVEVRGFEEGESPILNAIVTDAAIAGGNSGGPLLNIQGQVIGMTTASDDTPCCTYAIPSNTITHVVPILVENGEYIHPYIGLEPRTLSVGLLAESFEDLPSTFKGVVVTKIDRGGPAHKAGINGSITDQFGDPSGGDIITAIDGEPITTADEFNAYIDEHKFVGEKVELSIYRNGQTLNRPVTLEKNPDFSSNNK
jgi:S1-C subfamily serine protease